jgi:hypothetical protein
MSNVELIYMTETCKHFLQAPSAHAFVAHNATTGLLCTNRGYRRAAQAVKIAESSIPLKGGKQ